MNYSDLDRALAAIAGYALDDPGFGGEESSYLDALRSNDQQAPSSSGYQPSSEGSVPTATAYSSQPAGSGNAFRSSRDPWSVLISGATRGQSSPPSDNEDTQGWLTRLMNGDQKASNQARFGLGALGLLGSLRQSRQGSRNQLSPAQLQAMLKTPYSNWTADQQQAFNSYFYRPMGQFNPQPLPPGAVPPRMATGGQVGPQRGMAFLGQQRPMPQPMLQQSMLQRPMPQQPMLQRPMPQQPMPQQPMLQRPMPMPPGQPGGPLSRYATGGALIPGSDPGQSDRVHIAASPGEYMIDADVVSALGDGNNAAGAKRLDEMRQEIRSHKRQAPSSRIPPKALHPLAYLRK